MFKRLALILTASAALALAGCNFAGGGSPAESTPEAAATTPTASPTPLTLAPTLPPVAETASPSPTSELAPTALPAPTQIIPATSTPSTPGAPGAGGPGITLNPPVGEPGDTTIVEGTDFPPNAHVTLHWGPTGGPHGPVYWEQDADANGFFSVGLIVPPAAQWPGGAAKEGDLLQLQARSEAMGDSYVYANFTYVKRFNPQTSLVLTYSSTTYGYKVDVPNGWKWDDGEASNVRFNAPSGSAWGFVRALSLTDVNAAVQAVMTAEAPGQTFTSVESTLGAYSGTRVTAANGLVVWFIPANGRIYALSFTDNNGQFFDIIATSFRLD